MYRGRVVNGALTRVMEDSWTSEYLLRVIEIDSKSGDWFIANAVDDITSLLQFGGCDLRWSSSGIYDVDDKE